MNAKNVRTLLAHSKFSFTRMKKIVAFEFTFFVFTDKIVLSFFSYKPNEAGKEL